MNAPTLVTLVTLPLVLAMGSGCRTWRAVPPSSDLPRPLAAQSRLTRTDGARIELAGGLITADSVVGLSHAAGRVSVPRNSVARVEERRLSWGRSIGLFLAVYFGAAFVISGAGALPLP
ncbi:MAG: hypothetical protein M3282_06345 [Gemmatimonadota bacterium]|nr:hypothetical protein [Gemmatimonadota bacterium]